MEFKKRTLKQLGDLICGNFPYDESFFPYRSSSYLTEFFEDFETDFAHDGSTRVYWVAHNEERQGNFDGPRVLELPALE
jgi:hypothetical protein